MPHRRLAGVLVLVLFGLLSCERAASDSAVKALLSDPAAHDGAMVNLTGTVTNLDVRVSHRGNAYYTFKLDDGGGRITVFSFGPPPCSNGSWANVEGQFLREKKVSGYVFYNQVDATRVICD
jgi:hypothetical protein